MENTPCIDDENDGLPIKDGDVPVRKALNNQS
jgi:hypothetical protein